MDADNWRQAKSVLEAALLCAPAERDALVAARCADPWLRHEVLACLNEHDEDFLESALTISHTFEHATSTDDVEAPPDVQPGERIGRYEVVGRLGAGGMGHVFLGNDTELQRKVALKCLIASASAADIRSRILHEARAAARINHPNIAVVHDVVEHDGRPFLVMEYVEGENLAQSLKRERPALEKILAIGRQLASALTAAHAKGIIHRDLKPANIQLMPDGSVKILDFGVAHALAAEPEPATGGTTVAGVPLSTLATLRTERGAIRHPGTPAYMSPEQMFGKSIDGRSDIYSLGVILYEMATGHRPYSTDDPLDVVLALSHKLLRPSGAETHLPETVNDVIGKMLAVELDQRYQTAAEVETAFAALMGRDPTLAPATQSTRVKWLRRAVQVSAVLISIPLVVGAIGYMTTLYFNVSLGRTTPFDQESPRVWLTMGRMAILAPVLRMTLIGVGIWAVSFIVRVVRLSKRVDSILTEGQTRTKRLSSTLRLDDPVVMGQGVATIGLVGLLFVMWRFSDVLNAGMTYWYAEADIRQRLFTLQHWGRVTDYRIVLDCFTFVFVVAAVRVARLRARQPIRRGTGALAAVIATLALTVVLNQVWYRLVYQNKFERVDAAGDRCYIIGESTVQWLLFCPDKPPIRNRAVSRADSSVRRSGVIESIFSAPVASPETSH